MAEELKACPFCGGIPKTSHRPESEASGGGHVAFVVCYCGGYASTAHQMGHAETVQAAIAEVVEKWNTRALPPGQGGEAVEVVERYAPAWGTDRADNVHCYMSDDEDGEYMTVAQHQRILAAAAGSAEPVGEVRCDGDMVWQIDGDPFVWQRLGEGTKLYTYPADQVAKGVAVQEMEWLEQWLLLAAEPIGQECCGRAHLECCGNSEPVYRTAEEIAAAMNARREELRALLAKSEGVKL